MSPSMANQHSALVSQLSSLIDAIDNNVDYHIEETGDTPVCSIPSEIMDARDSAAALLARITE